MSVYKRSDWNDLLDSVNNVLQNPPAGCDPLDPIPHVGLKHRWSKADIQEVQNKLITTCPTITFASIPELWKQSTIDEINNALGQAWCDCEECDPFIEHNTIIEIREINSEFGTSCNGDDPHGGDPNAFGGYQWIESEPLCNVINGLQVGSPGISGRRWRVLMQRHNASTFQVAEGNIDDDGFVLCTSGSSVIYTAYGYYVNCPTGNILIQCGSANCDAQIATWQGVQQNDQWRRWILVINSDLADCV